MEPTVDRYLAARRARIRHQVKSFRLSGDYGPNTSLVLEALALVNETTLLRATQLPADERFTPIADYNQAQRYASETCYGKDEYIWSDICAHEIARIKGLTSRDRHWEPFLDSFYSDSNRFVQVVECSLPFEFDDLADCVFGDIVYSAEARLVVGTKSQFHEILLAIYALGGWPCGWDGDYPAGRMVGFFPVNSQPKLENEQPTHAASFS